MQLTFKFVLIAVALAYGGTTVSALPVGESSLAARSAEYEDFEAREVDDIEFFAREPFNSYGNTDQASGNFLSSYGTPGVSKIPVSASTTPSTSSSPATGAKTKKGKGAHYDPKPTRDVGERRQFRKDAAQNPALVKAAAKDPTHPYHSTARHMKQEAALRRKPELMKQALNDKNHHLYKAAKTVKAQAGRRKAIRTALKDENHPKHAHAVAHMNRQQDEAVKRLQTSKPGVVDAALANKNHHLHHAAHRVVKEQDRSNNQAAFAALPLGL